MFFRGMRELGETSAPHGNVELFRGRGKGLSSLAVSLFTWAGGGSGRADPMRDGARAVCGSVGLGHRPTPYAPHLLQTAPCTPAWMKWPRSRRSSSVARSRMSRYCSPGSLVSYPWWVGVVPEPGLIPRPEVVWSHPVFLTLLPSNILPYSVWQQYAGCGHGCQPP